MGSLVGRGGRDRFSDSNSFFSINSLGSLTRLSHTITIDCISTLLKDMNFFIALFKLKYSATGGLTRYQTGLSLVCARRSRRYIRKV